VKRIQNYVLSMQMIWSFLMQKT